MLGRFLDYFRGIVEGELVSAEPGQALTDYTMHGIHLRNPTLAAPLTLHFTVTKSDWKKLQTLSEQRGETCTMVNEWGLAVSAQRWKSRIPFWAALILISMFTLYLPKRVLFLRVEGNQRVSSREVLEAANSCGLHFWTKSEEIRSEELKNDLLTLIPALQWAGVNFSGSVATISVTERLDAEPIKDRQQLTNVVSARDGIVVEMSILGGQAQCRLGQAVRRGELLVSGCVDHEHTVQYTQAEAEIYALTQHEIETVIPEKTVKKHYTGKTEKSYSILLGRKRINLSRNSGISTYTCDKMIERIALPLPGDYTLPCNLLIETKIYYTLEPVPAPESQETLEDAALRIVKQGMLAGEILDRSTKFFQANGAYTLKMTSSCREMIARQQPVKLFEGDYTDE